MVPAELQIRGLVLERAIGARCPARPAARRIAAGRPGRGLPIGDPIGLSFGSAIRAHPELRSELIESGRRIASSPIGDAVLREFLLAAGVKHADAKHVKDGERLLLSPGFCLLGAPVRRELVRIYGRLAPSPGLRGMLVELVDANVLDPRTALELARYIAGPEIGAFSEPSHARTIERYWSGRVPELRALIFAMRAAVGRGASAVPLAEAYLHDPVRRLGLIRPLSGSGAIIVFGDPASPESLSYGQRWTWRESGAPLASLQSPDPSVAGAWSPPAPLHDEEVELRSALLTRMEELTLIRWVEGNHTISRRRVYRPSTVPFSVFVGSRGIERAIEVVSKIVTAARGGITFERSRMRGGRGIGGGATTGELNPPAPGRPSA